MRKILKPLLYLFLICTFLWTVLVVRIYIDSITEQRAKVDAVVVMGASQWNGRPSPALKARLDHALRIYNEGIVKYIILTGGIAPGDTVSESAVGKEYLADKGIPENVIFIEEKGHTTLESIREVSRIVKDKDINRIIFVSHGYHLYRVRKIAESMDIEDPLISAVGIKDDKKKIKLVLRESVVYLYYLVSHGYSDLTASS